MTTLRRILMLAVMLATPLAARAQGICIGGAPCIDGCPAGTSCPGCGPCNTGRICVFKTPIPVVNMSLAVTNGVSPFTGWESGTQFSATQTGTAPTFGIDNDGAWGSGSDNGLSPASGAGTVTLSTGGDSTHRTVTLNSLTVNIASFAHSAIAPSTTGLNTFTLDTSFVNSGIINVQTGEITNLRVHFKLNNSYYPAGSERLAVVDCSGSINLSTYTMSITFNGFVPA